MTELVWVALIAAGGPIIALWARPIGEAISARLLAGERQKERQSTTAREAQDAMVLVMSRRSSITYNDDVKAARALALAVLPVAERIHADAAREAVRDFVAKATSDGVLESDIHDAYRKANELLGAIIRA
jgi:hypothetical protein